MSNEYMPPFPGEEFAITLQNEAFTQHVYETGTIHYGHTTTGQVVALPTLEYWAQTISANGDMQFTERASMITEEIMTSDELTALNRARVLQYVKEQGDNTPTPFSPLRKIVAAEDGLLQLCVPEEGNGLDEDIPFASVRTIVPLGDIDFVTAVQGHYGMFRYHSGDILSFAPQDMVDANAYRFIDHPRLLTGGADNRKFQIAKVRLYRAGADLSAPLPKF
jgi:hypothetical protein